MPNGFGFGEIAQLPCAVECGVEPIGVGGGDAHAFDAGRCASLESFGRVWIDRRGDCANVFVSGEGRCEFGGITGEEIHHAGREVGGGEHFAEQDSRVGVSGRRKGDDRISGGDRMEGQRDQCEQRIFWRCDDANDADWLGDGEIEMRGGHWIYRAEDLLEFVGPAGEVDDAIDRGADFMRSGFRIGVGEAEGLGHFRGACLEHFGETIEDLRAVVGRAF